MPTQSGLPASASVRILISLAVRLLISSQTAGQKTTDRGEQLVGGDETLKGIVERLGVKPHQSQPPRDKLDDDCDPQAG